MSVIAAVQPRVSATSVTFAYPDPGRELTAVRLVQEVRRPRVGPEFARAPRGRTWRLTFPRPDVDRMEYLLELETDGTFETIPDPSNPLRAPGPWGDKSAIEFPDYEAPHWVGVEGPEGTLQTLEIRSRAYRANVPLLIWSSPGTQPSERLPLLIAHDGPEYADYASLVKYLDVMADRGELPPMRAALLDPIDRDQSYSAAAAWGRTLVNDILPVLEEVAPHPPRPRLRVGMGASLGALAALHAHRQHHDLFGALFLQSGSFFRPKWYRHEEWHPRYHRIIRFVGRTHLGKDASPVPVTITCGTAEENLANNRALADALDAQGYDVRLHEQRDAHNWTAWRDSFRPHLTELLQRQWP
jgi:enterochelin esterase family protein